MDSDLVDEEAFEVEHIEGHRLEEDGTHSYYIKWLNYGRTENTWVPEENMDSPDILKKYWNQHNLKESRAQAKSQAKSQKGKRKRRSFASRRTNYSSNESEENDTDCEGSSSRKRNTTRKVATRRAKQNSPMPVETSAPKAPSTRSKKLPAPPPLPKRGISVPNKQKNVENTNVDPDNQVKEGESSTSTSQTAVDSNSMYAALSTSFTSITKEATPEMDHSSKESSPFDHVTVRKTTRTARARIIEDDDDEDEDIQTDHANENVGSSSNFPNERENVTQNNPDDKLSGLEKGYEIQCVTQLAKQDSIVFGLVKYFGHSLLEWVSCELIEDADPNALIQFHEGLLRRQMKID